MKRALLTLLCTLSALAQWPSDPAQNLLICDHTGEQALPKIAATSDGGCYIAWQDLSMGNYDIYLQLLDEAGVPQWDNPCGLLVSDHPQDTWLTDWDLAVDVSDRCILAINDIRNGADRDITAYCINRLQEFAWGDDGIAISNNDGFEPDPRILPMDNGDVVFAWQEETSIHVRKLDSAGADVFNPSTITFSQANGVSIPRLAALDNSGFALSYLAQQGTQFTSPRHLYVRSYNDDGSSRWVEAGIPIMTTNGIGIQMKPDLVYDGHGGVFVYWYDARGNVHHCYGQHIENDGVAHWTANGVQVDLTANELQMSPSAVATDSGLVLFYQTANPNQTQGGVQAQMLDWLGNYTWDTNGITVVSLSAEPCFNVRAFKQGFEYGVFFSQYAPGSAINTLLRASQLSAMGEFTWTPPITDLCTVASEKGRPYACNNLFNQMLVAWPDSRSATMDIYAQDVNVDGTLGPNTVLPPEIRIVSPLDGDTVRDADIDLTFEVENYIIAPGFGDGWVSIQVNDQDPTTTNMVAPYPVTLHTGENTIRVEILDLGFEPLDPPVTDEVQVSYVPLNPSITITSPSQDTLTFNPVPVHFTVADFIVSDSTGDGHIRVINIRNFWGDIDTVAFDYYSLEPVDAELAFLATNTVCLWLVDQSGNQLDPPVFDCVAIEYGEIAADPLPDGVPREFAISSTYPNPFNSTLSIGYDVPKEASISIGVYDLMGRHVATIFDGSQTAGRHTVQWNANDAATGVYFVRLETPQSALTRKVLLIR